VNVTRTHHGFTLVELVAALSVTVLVVGSTAVILRTVTAARGRVDKQMAAQQEARAAINAVVTALRNAQRPAPDQRPLLDGADDWRGDEPADRIRFFTISHRTVRHEQPESDLRQVEFALMESDDPDAAGAKLMRRTDPTLNAEPDGGGIIERIAENVVSFDIRYHNGIDWQDDWPERQNGWPKAIRVRLSIVHDQQRHTLRSVSRLIAFPHWPNARGRRQ